jgi:transcription elongation factor GreA
MADKFQMTQKGYDEAVKRLEYLQTVKRDEIVERIVEARSHGDLSENAEYDAARNEQAANEGEILELEYKIKNAEIIIEAQDTSSVHIGTKVTVYDPEFEEEETYEITGTTEMSIKDNKISNLSPVGKALVGKKVGDVVTVYPENNNPSYTLKIVKIALARDEK